MSEVSSISENSSILAVVLDEKNTFEPVSELYTQAQEAIENENFDRAIEIIVKLDKKQCKGEVKVGEFSSVLQKLWNKDSKQGEKLIGLVTQSWSLSVEGNIVHFKSLENISNGSFPFERKTTPEGRALFDKAYGPFCNRDYEAFEPAFKEVLEGTKNSLISVKDLFEFIHHLAWKNITAIEKFFPLINSYFHVSIEGASLFLQAPGHSLTLNSGRYLLRDFDVALKLLSEEESPSERIHLALIIANLHESKAVELLKKMAADLNLITNLDEKIDACYEIANYCMGNQQFQILHALLSNIEKMNTSVEDEVEQLNNRFQVLLFRIDMSLTEKNKTAFDLHLSAAKKELAKVADPEKKEEMKDTLLELTENGDEVFGVDQMVLHANKV